MAKDSKGFEHPTREEAAFHDVSNVYLNWLMEDGIRMEFESGERLMQKLAEDSKEGEAARERFSTYIYLCKARIIRNRQLGL